jgi:Xaa-Pro aminopeptidase
MTPSSNGPATSAAALVARRKALGERLDGPALLAAGLPQARNYRANIYPFRAKSHFLYLVGRHMPGAALLVNDGKSVLFTEPPDPEDALWHGPRASFEQLTRELGVDEVANIASIDRVLGKLGTKVATLPTEDAASAIWLSERLGRSIAPCGGDRLDWPDDQLADAMIALRLEHDEAALAQLRHAAAVSAEAHVAGMRATKPGGSEQDVHAAMVAVLRRAGLEDAYNPIVTTSGEVLHSMDHSQPTNDGDLLLADVGGETLEGWAADITRTWPVSGTYSSSQRAIYDVVLAAQLACIEAVKPGVGYRDIHEIAKRTIVDGLVQLSILRGDVDGLLQRGAAAIFFPHGVGHIIGLDVHDMEDLGDRAGYAPGRERAQRFGDAYLRLDRDLAEGMLVTIEPGFYQVAGILEDPQYTGAVGDDLNRTELAKYADVRGIRIEDDVLVTADGSEVLTRGVPKQAGEVEAMMAGS